MAKKEFDNKNQGVLFKNEKENDKQPDYKGSFTDSNDVEYWLAAWKKLSKDGETSYLRIVATAKEDVTPVKSKPKGKGKATDTDDF